MRDMPAITSIPTSAQGDVAYIPEMRTQIVSARTVAEVVAGIATSDGDPAQIAEIAGPREEDLAQLATMLVARRGTPVKVLLVRNPADPDADMQATGGMLPGPGAQLAVRRSRSGSTSSSGDILRPLRVRPTVPGRACRAGHDPTRHYMTRLVRFASTQLDLVNSAWRS